jgi:hypothetical protein
MHPQDRRVVQHVSTDRRATRVAVAVSASVITSGHLQGSPPTITKARLRSATLIAVYRYVLGSDRNCG